MVDYMAELDWCLDLGLEYVDLYLIHWPLKLNQDELKIPIPIDCIAPINIKDVWEGMEKCQDLGFTKSIGVSNFSPRLIEEILSFAKIPPAVNQVEMNPVWQQKKLNEFCKKKDILLTGYSPLGASGAKWGHNLKSFNTERMKQNLDIFDWSLSEEELIKISHIPQQKHVYLAGSMVERANDVITEIDAGLAFQ
ncbi:putative D-galacturonate reductase [Helianthus anomalus]